MKKIYFLISQSLPFVLLSSLPFPFPFLPNHSRLTFLLSRPSLPFSFFSLSLLLPLPLPLFPSSPFPFPSTPLFSKFLFVNLQLERKRHIGNDIAIIVFNESNEPFDTSLITSQFVHVII